MKQIEDLWKKSLVQYGSVTVLKVSLAEQTKLIEKMMYICNKVF